MTNRVLLFTKSQVARKRRFYNVQEALHGVNFWDSWPREVAEADSSAVVNKGLHE